LRKFHGIDEMINGGSFCSFIGNRYAQKVYKRKVYYLQGIFTLYSKWENPSKVF